MDGLFEYAPKSKHVKMPYNVSFGLIYDDRNSVLLTGADQKTGKKMYLYTLREVGATPRLRRSIRRRPWAYILSRLVLPTNCYALNVCAQ